MDQFADVTTDEGLRKCHDFIIKLAIDAGRIMTAGFYKERKSVAQKSSQKDLVTETDSAVEQFVIAAIREKFPNHIFIGEESPMPAEHLSNEPTWMIDPIDGTMNFVHNNPNICLSIGLLVEKIPVLGVIYNPIANELFTARRGNGAYCNGQPIHVSAATEMAGSLLLAGFGSHLLTEKQSIFEKLINTIHGVRTFGSITVHMCLVARGGADISYDFGLHCWDMAAGTVIVREAGGVVVDTSGGDLDIMSRRFICAATPELAKELSRHLENCNFQLARD